MKATTYLTITTLKNRFKELLKNPAKLIFSIIFTLMIIGFVVMSFILPPSEDSTTRNINELYLIILGYFSIIFFPICLMGLKTGSTFFSMPDVNLLFTAPIKPKTILRYGLINKMGTSLLFSLLLFFQVFWLRESYALQFTHFLVILFSYAITVFFGHLLAVAIYSYSSFNEKRRTIIKSIFYLLFFINLAYITYIVFENYPNWTNIINEIASMTFLFIPVTGWFTTFIIGVMETNILFIVLGLIPNVILAIAVIASLGKLNTNFYEDVIKTTENIYAITSAQKEGKAAQFVPTKVKLGKVGLNKGQGASAFFYKHLKENKRSKVFIFDGMQMLFAVMAIIIAILTKDIGILPAFAMTTYLTLLFVSLGKWVRELQTHYIYLAPEKPFKKLLMILGESIYTNAIFSTILFTIVGIITQASISDIIITIIGYISFNYMFIAVTAFAKRITGVINNKIFSAFLHILSILILVFPGVIFGIIVGTLVHEAFLVFSAIGIMIVWNLIVATLLIFFSRNLLVYTELQH